MTSFNKLSASVKPSTVIIKNEATGLCQKFRSVCLLSRPAGVLVRDCRQLTPQITTAQTLAIKMQDAGNFSFIFVQWEEIEPRGPSFIQSLGRTCRHRHQVISAKYARTSLTKFEIQTS